MMLIFDEGDVVDVWIEARVGILIGEDFSCFRIKGVRVAKDIGDTNQV